MYDTSDLSYQEDASILNPVAITLTGVNQSNAIPVDVKTEQSLGYVDPVIFDQTDLLAFDLSAADLSESGLLAVHLSESGLSAVHLSESGLSADDLSADDFANEISHFLNLQIRQQIGIQSLTQFGIHGLSLSLDGQQQQAILALLRQ